MATAASIAQTFAAAQIAVETTQIERLARQLQAAGGDLERLISCLVADDHPDLKLALRYRSALRCEADPLVLARRLRIEACDLDHHADKAVKDAADHFGMAAARRLRGNDDSVAANAERAGHAAQEQAVELTNAAFEKRLAASRIEGEHQRRADLSNTITSMKAA